MYDAIIIGARSAGASTALLLARRGYRVLLVDRDTFPSDSPTGHVIMLGACARLARWGLLDRIAASGCPPIATLTLDPGPAALTGTPPPAGDVTAAYAPRQTVIATVLGEAAIGAGVELREGFSVQEVVTDGERVTGIRGRANGATVTETARIVIGADGLHSRLARLVQAPVYNERPTLTANYWSYWSGVLAGDPAMYLRDGRLVGAFPTNDGLTCLFLTIPQAQVAACRADIEGNLLRTLALAPALAERVGDGRREERFYGATDQRNFFRTPYGPGWALVGDAGYHKDPITAQGVTDAFRDAELLAEAIDAGLSGREPLDQALAGYERRRNEAAMPMYEFTCGLATLELPPDMQALIAALRGNHEQTDRFIGTIAGTVPIPEFFAPENIGRIMGAERDVAA